MSNSNKGFVQIPSDFYIVGLLIIKGENSQTSIVNPDEIDIDQLCDEYLLPFDKLMSSLRSIGPETHTVIIDAEVFRRD